MESLNFLRHPRGPPLPPDLGTVLVKPSDNQVVARIPGLSISRIEERCPVLAAAFEPRRNQPNATHCMEDVTTHAASCFLRWAYTGTYLPDLENSCPTSLFTLLQLIDLGIRYAADGLRCEAFAEFMTILACTPSAPEGLMPAIVFAYRKFKATDSVVAAIFSYCLRNLLKHELDQDERFQRLLIALPEFHKELCIVARLNDTCTPESQFLIKYGFPASVDMTVRRPARPGADLATLAALVAVMDQRTEEYAFCPEDQLPNDPTTPSDPYERHDRDTEYCEPSLLPPSITAPSPEPSSPRNEGRANMFEPPTWENEGGLRDLVSLERLAAESRKSQIDVLRDRLRESELSACQTQREERDKRLRQNLDGRHWRRAQPVKDQMAVGQPGSACINKRGSNEPAMRFGKKPFSPSDLAEVFSSPVDSQLLEAAQRTLEPMSQGPQLLSTIARPFKEEEGIDIGSPSLSAAREPHAIEHQKSPREPVGYSQDLVLPIRETTSSNADRYSASEDEWEKVDNELQMVQSNSDAPEAWAWVDNCRASSESPTLQPVVADNQLDTANDDDNDDDDDWLMMDP